MHQKVSKLLLLKLRHYPLRLKIKLSFHSQWIICLPCKLNVDICFSKPSILKPSHLLDIEWSTNMYPKTEP